MIHRTEHEENFLVISNDTIRDLEISDGAFRLLVFMLSCSDDFEFNVKGLATCLNVSERVINYRIKELKEAGYISVDKKKDKLGLFGEYDWNIFEQAINRDAKNPNSDKTETQKIRTRTKPNLGKVAPIRNNNIKEIPNVKEISKDKEIYGEFQNVLLSVDEFQKLGEQFGEENRDSVLEQLSGYIVEHPRKYKNHFLTLRNWLLRRQNDRPKPRPKQDPEQFTNPFTELLKKEGYL